MILSERKNEGKCLFSEKTEASCANLNERQEAATSNSSTAVDFLQYTCSVLVAKNH